MAAPNWANQTIWTGDNLAIMRGMNSASVDLMYLDPPFNSRANYAAPIGSKAAGAAFKDTWGLDDINLAWYGEIKHEYPGLYDLLTAVRTIHGDSMMSYLIYMAVRLIEMKRLLKDTGSLYLHCDPTASHYLKLLLDTIFGMAHFQNEITWKRTTTKGDWRQGATNYPRVHDVLLYYSKDVAHAAYQQAFVPYGQDYIKKSYRHVEPETGRRYRLDNLSAPGGGQRGHPRYELLGVTRYWRYNEEKMHQLLAAGRIIQTAPGRVPAYKRYLDEMPGVAVSDVWADIAPVQGSAKERQGYPTQKPLALVRRLVQTSAPTDGVVLDPFCGCATACIAAEMEGRHCNGCETHFELRHFHVDHIIARSKGGTDHISNLQLLCGSCNTIKGTKTQEELIVALTDKGYIKRKMAA